MEKFSEQQVEQLAPDNNLKAAKTLLNLSKWPVLGCSDRALWGSCQGSGKNPYKVMVDLRNHAVKCSCPSRKIPCKHSLALMLLTANYESNFTSVADGQEIPEVIEWLDKREARQAAKEQKAANAEKKPVDLEAQAKRLEARNSKILEGIDLLEQWLKDVIRTGLAKGLSSSDEIYNGASDLIKRMIDAQAPGLANRLKQIAELACPGCVNDDTYYPLLKELSQLFMLIQAYRNVDTMPEDWQIELRRLIGFNDKTEDVLARPGVSDQWLLVNLEINRDEYTNLSSYKYHFYGLNTNTYTYVLSFVPKGQSEDNNFFIGHVYDGEMHFYPSVSSIKRALLVLKNKEDQGGEFAKTEFKINGLPDFVELFKAQSQYFAVNPFAENFVGLVDNVRFATQGSGNSLVWSLVDADGHALQILDEKDGLKNSLYDLLSLTLGHPFTAMVRVVRGKLVPISAIFEGKVIPFRC